MGNGHKNLASSKPPASFAMQRSLSAPIFALSQPAFTAPPAEGGAEEQPARPQGKERKPPPGMIPTPHDLQILQRQVIWGLRVLTKKDWWLQFLTWEEADRAIEQNWAVITLLANMTKEERERSFSNTKPTLIIVALVQLAVCLRNDDKDFIVMSVEAQQIYNAVHIRDRLMEVKLHGPAEWKVYDDEGNVQWSLTPDVKSRKCDIVGLVNGVDGKNDKLYPEAVYVAKLTEYSSLLKRACGLELPKAILEGCNPTILEDGFTPTRRTLIRRVVAHRADVWRQYREQKNEERKAGFYARFGHAWHRHPCHRAGNRGQSLEAELDEDFLPLGAPDGVEVLLPGEDEKDEQYDRRLEAAIAKRVAKGKDKQGASCLTEDAVSAGEAQIEAREQKDLRLEERLAVIRASASKEAVEEECDESA